MFSKNNYDSSSKLANNINKQIYNRNLPSQILQPYVDIRPVMTKYATMPIMDMRGSSHVPLTVQPLYNIETTFNPGNRMAPWSGFATNINVESELRNQVYALQKCSQSVYVPSSTSDLYNFNFTTSPQVNQYPQTYPLLFQKYIPDKFNPNPERIGLESFNNHTRQQLKNISS